MNIDPLQNDAGRLRLNVAGLEIRLFEDGLGFIVGGASVFVPTEVFELFLAQRARAAEGQPDPCLHCRNGEPIFLNEEDGIAVHHIWHGETEYDEPCLNLPAA